MLVKLPNLTDISISRLTEHSQQHLPPHRALSISHLHNRSYSSSRPNPIQLRQNQLLWMFNRRKQKLIETSVQNYKLYNRIKTQKSQLAKFNRAGARIQMSRLWTEGHEEDKENMEVLNCIKEKEQKIEMMLNRSLNKDWKKHTKVRGKSQAL